MLRIISANYKGHAFSYVFYSRIQLEHDLEKFRNDVDFVFCESL